MKVLQRCLSVNNGYNSKRVAYTRQVSKRINIQKSYFTFYSSTRGAIAMFTIGIVDVTTVGSTICQRRINELGGLLGNYPEFAVHSFPFKEYRPATINKDWVRMAELVSASIDKLNRMNVDFIIIPSNTPHYAYKEFTKNSSVPILDLIEITAQACKEANIKKVAILGTKATMMGGLYKDKIEVKGMSLVIPLVDTCDVIHKFIMDEIVPGQVNEYTRQTVLKLIRAIECDGFILGCTELPEVYSTAEIGKTAIDTTRLLAEVAFNIAMTEDRKLMMSYATHMQPAKTVY